MLCIEILQMCRLPQFKFYLKINPLYEKNYLGYTKLLVGVGATISGKYTNVELIDLESSASNCSSLKDFPQYTAGAIGGLDFSDSPVICGGGYKQECFSWQDSAWQIFDSLIQKRYHASVCLSPFPKESHKLLVTGGGFNGSGEF